MMTRTLKDVKGDYTGKKVNGDVESTDKNITSLEGAPEYIGGVFYCDPDPNILKGDNQYKIVKMRINSSEDNIKGILEEYFSRE